MKRILSVDLAGKILLSAFVVMLIMHGLILLQVVPSSIVWRGQIKDDQSNLTQLETVAITLTLVFTGVVAAKMNLIQPG